MCSNCRYLLNLSVLYVIPIIILCLFLNVIDISPKPEKLNLTFYKNYPSQQPIISSSGSEKYPFHAGINVPDATENLVNALGIWNGILPFKICFSESMKFFTEHNVYIRKHNRDFLRIQSNEANPPMVNIPIRNDECKPLPHNISNLEFNFFVEPNFEPELLETLEGKRIAYINDPHLPDQFLANFISETRITLKFEYGWLWLLIIPTIFGLWWQLLLTIKQVHSEFLK